jgi:O-antigen ligase
LSEETGANRFSGLSSHPNHLSTVINLTIPLAFYISKVFKFKKLNLFFVPVFLYGQILTGSRIGLVGCITILILCLKYLLNVKLGTLLVLALCGGITLLVVPQLVENLFSGSIRLFSNASDITQSNYARLSLAKQGIADFLGNPFFGIGPRAFKSSHNIFLQVLASLGICGLAAFIFLLKRVFFTRTKNSELLIASRLSFASVLISGLFSNALADFFLYLPVSVILGSLSKNSDRGSGGVN